MQKQSIWTQEEMQFNGNRTFDLFQFDQFMYNMFYVSLLSQWMINIRL